MKRVVLFLVTVLSLFSFTAFSQTDFYSKNWQRVYKYEIKGLPKSAQGVVDTIYTRAKANQNIAESTKALLYQSKYALILGEDAELVVVNQWKKEIALSKAPLRNILESMLATMYWEYFKANRYDYYRRSTVNGRLSDDFRTWDLKNMLSEIHLHLQNSLNNIQTLQTIRIETLSDLLIEAEYSRLYRPYLYDLLVHNSISFYETDETAYNFGPRKTLFKVPQEYESFQSVSAVQPDSLDRTLLAVKLYHEAIAFHVAQRDTAAIVSLELEALKWLETASSKRLSPSLYGDALRNLKKRYHNHSASALITFELAFHVNKLGNEYATAGNNQNQLLKKEAVQLCRQTIREFPKSHGALQAQSLLDNILAKNINLKAETFIPVQAPARVQVQYTNLDSIRFAIYKTEAGFEESFRQLNDSLKLVRLKAMKVELGWSTRLTDLTDYQQHSTEVIVPALPSGRYMVVAFVPDREHAEYDQTFAFVTIQVTDLALLTGNFDAINRYQVVNRLTGKPVENARLHFNKWLFRDSVLITDRNGFVTIPAHQQESSYVNISVSHGQDQATFGDYYMYRSSGNADRKEDIDVKSFIFTDRSIYRPGQTIYFKGILIQTQRKKSTIVKGEFVEVFLEDVDGSEVGMLRLKTNSYGSFSGEFKIPASGLTGEYRLYADEDSESDTKFYDELDHFESERTLISVEEYKRPNFEITFKPVTQTFRMGDTVMINGTATAFNGATLSGATVAYTIKRSRSYDRRYRDYGSREQLITGDTLVAGDGSFSISFITDEDEIIPREYLPVFTYEIEVAVTDISGETRTASSEVKVGFHALTVRLDAPRIVDRKKTNHTFTVSTTNLNGRFIAAKGMVRIYKLSTPATPQRPRPWPSPDLPLLTKKEFELLFPHDAYEDAPDSENDIPGKLIFELPFNTAETSAVAFSSTVKWPLGEYTVAVVAADTSGYEIRQRYPLTVMESGSREVFDNKILLLQTDKESYRVGDFVSLTLGSASSDITIMLDIEGSTGSIKSSVEHFSGNARTINFAVTEEMEAGFSILATAVNYNAFFKVKKHVTVIRTVNLLTFETLTFRDKLQPGASTTWSFEVKGIPAHKDAEVLASMYDASLDQFKPHSWYFDPHDNQTFWGNYDVSADKSFDQESFSVRNYHRVPRIMAARYYDKFDWFGFGITRSKYLHDSYLLRLYATNPTPEKPSRVKMGNERTLKDGFVSGTVTDPKGQPLYGVSVTIAGTVRGTLTDMQGSFLLEAKKGETLRFTFIGMNSAEAKIGRKNIIHVFMEEDFTQLSEIVITAGGLTVQRRELGNQATTVKSREFNQEFTFEESLSGKVPGLLVTNSEGSKNYRIVLRGNRSLNGNNQLLYVVDGVIVNGLKVNEDDIANINVLQGSAATALYGSAAANGVVIVTTISGQRKLDEAFAKVNVRKDFKETAFFFPHLVTNELGRVRFSFTTPESLTRWKMQLLAHTDDLRVGQSTLPAVTQKELMISPNVPRFLREGDTMTLSAKITNLSGQKKEGFATLQLFNAITGEAVNKSFGNVISNVRFKIASNQNSEVSWKFVVPAGMEAVQYKIIAKAGNFSDGEQNILPVLSNRIVVTETLPLNVRAGQTKTFTLDKLKTQSSSSTLRHQRLTLEITSNPAWYAVRSLPYLIEYPHECAEQLFSRYYANTLASHVINSNPKIKQVFDAWSSSGALISNLEKNPELKSILLQETPWLRDAQNETEQQKRIALLFDLNTLNSQRAAVVSRLSDLQLSDGGFPWFAGGDASPYITRHIAASYGHLRKLGVSKDYEMLRLVENSITFLDNEFVKSYHRHVDYNDNAVVTTRRLDNDIVHYLYMRSFFPEIKMGPKTKATVDYYLKEGAEHWVTLNLYAKGMMALIQLRNNNLAAAQNIVNSLRENSITSEELGMYWKENQSSWYWYQSPVETQALMIEVFTEIESVNQSVSERQAIVDELRIWLLKNKQTSQWETTRATSEAIYALLLQGSDWLSVSNAVAIQVGGKNVVPDTSKVEAGTGYFKTSWAPEAITPAMGEVKLTNTGAGISWGALYWQYAEQLDKITPAETALKLSKKVFKVIRTSAGESITEVKEGVELQVGDLLRVRIELRSDREMEFIHMKDMRAAGLEPVDVLSKYRWQEGLGYYQSTRDASTNFFFDRISKGVYVFEYDLRVNSKGDFSNGITTLQCMYAPEFSSHSEGIRISVK